MTITIHILNQGQPVGTVEHAPPLTVAEAERGLQDEDISWIGVLQAVGSTVRLPPQHDLADGAAFELVLHRQSVSVLQLSEQEWLKQQLEPPTLVDSVRAHRQDVNKYTMAP